MRYRVQHWQLSTEKYGYNFDPKKVKYYYEIIIVKKKRIFEDTKSRVNRVHLAISTIDWIIRDFQGITFGSRNHNKIIQREVQNYGAKLQCQGHKRSWSALTLVYSMARVPNREKGFCELSYISLTTLKWFGKSRLHSWEVDSTMASRKCLMIQTIHTRNLEPNLWSIPFYDIWVKFDASSIIV